MRLNSNLMGTHWNEKMMVMILLMVYDAKDDEREKKHNPNKRKQRFYWILMIMMNMIRSQTRFQIFYLSLLFIYFNFASNHKLLFWLKDNLKIMRELWMKAMETFIWSNKNYLSCWYYCLFKISWDSFWVWEAINIIMILMIQGNVHDDEK